MVFWTGSGGGACPVLLSLQILEDRHGLKSTLVASQLPLKLWHEQIGDPTLANAILNWLAHNAHSDIQQSLIADHLDRLLHPDNLALHFQPIIHTQHSGVQLEALLRLTDTTLGRINPETFLLVCELQGKTAEVDRMILCNALDHLCNWRAQGLDAVAISVNVAPVTLMHDSFAPWLGLQLAQRGPPPAHPEARNDRACRH